MQPACKVHRCKLVQDIRSIFGGTQLGILIVNVIGCKVIPLATSIFAEQNRRPYSRDALHCIFSVTLSKQRGCCTGTPLKTVYIGCPKQVLVLAGPGDHGDCENIFFMKILPVL